MKSVILPRYIYVVCTVECAQESFYPVVCTKRPVRFFLHLDEAFRFYKQQYGVRSFEEDYPLEDLIEFGRGREFTSKECKRENHKNVLFAHCMNYDYNLKDNNLVDMEEEDCATVIKGHSYYYDQSFTGAKPGTKLPPFYFTYTVGGGRTLDDTVSRLNISTKSTYEPCTCFYCDDTRVDYECKGIVEFDRDMYF